MVAFYVYKIQHGEMTIEQVPTLWRAKVQEVLDSQVD